MELTGRVVDLTHPIEQSMPVSIGMPRVLVTPYLDQAAGDVATVETWHTTLHTGTHVDAPMHFLPGAATVDRLDPLALAGTALVVDVRGLAGRADQDGWVEIAAADITGWEDATGERIGRDDIVLLHTGHARHWAPLPAGRAYVTQGWPYLGQDGAALLAGRGIRALGVDCPDPDRVDQRDLASATFPAHRTLLGAGIPIIENLARLGDVMAQRVTFLALAMPIRGASGSPVRALAFEPV